MRRTVRCKRSLRRSALGVALCGPRPPHLRSHVDFVATGGYALKAYERYAKLKPTDDGKLRIGHPRFAQQYRLNAGTIVAARCSRSASSPGAGGSWPRAATSRAAASSARWRKYFIDQLAPGDTFVFAGEVLRFDGLVETEAFVTRAAARDPMIPSYAGGKFPLSTHLAMRVRAMLADEKSWSGSRSPWPTG